MKTNAELFQMFEAATQAYVAALEELRKSGTVCSVCIPSVIDDSEEIMAEIMTNLLEPDYFEDETEEEEEERARSLMMIIFSERFWDLTRNPKTSLPILETFE